DVAGHHDHLSERQDAVVVAGVLADDARPDLNAARTGVDVRLRRHDLLFECRRNGHDLERRSRLVQILNGAITPTALVVFAIRVRIERRLVRHRENLAGARVHDDDGAAGRAVVQDALMQLALGDVLEILVDGQLDGRTGCRRTLEAAERMSPRVGLNEDRPLLAADLRIVGVLEAAQAGVVDSHIPEEVRGELLVRIETPALLDEADPLEVERGDAARLIRRYLPADVRKRFLLAEAIDEKLPFLGGAVLERLAQL